jgi:hypothetical protein
MTVIGVQVRGRRASAGPGNPPGASGPDRCFNGGITTFLAGAALHYEEAVEDRHAIAHRAVIASNAFDSEVAVARFLLQGLSRSPAMKDGDLRAFYDQLVETPHLEGAWFVLWDMNGQILNSI